MKEGKFINFGDIFSIQMGKTPSRNDKSCWDSKKVTKNKWVSIADISKYEGKEILETKEYISDLAAQKIYKVAKGSLLMSFKLTIGKMCFAGCDLYTNEAIIAIPENKKYNLRFLYYYLSSYPWYTLTEGAEKVKGKTLNKSSLAKIKLPIATLDEQERIVSYLDAQFAKIDAVRANAEKELQDAKALFQAALDDLSSPKKGWKENCLGELAGEMYRGSGITRAQVTEDGISCVRYGEIYTTYNYHFDSCVSHTEESNISSRKYFEHGDILFAITGESVEDIGKSIAYLGNDRCLAGGDIVVMKHKLNPKFLGYILSSSYVIKQKGLGKTKLKVVHTNVPSLKSIIIHYPSTLAEQRQIAEKLDSLSEKLQSLQFNYDQTISLCNDLKQSLLKDIFA